MAVATDIRALGREQSRGETEGCTQMLQKIHCNLLDVWGPEWGTLADEQVDRMVDCITEMDLMGSDDDLFGFVGTVHLDQVIGGYFVIQFPTELVSFTRDKHAKVARTDPAETVLFVFFPRVGRVLLQSKHFQILPIDTEALLRRLKEALADVLQRCKVGSVVSLMPTPIVVTNTELIEAYRGSRRVIRLRVTRPDAELIPEDITYYNPQRDRNAILRDDRLHDYPKFERIELDAKKAEDLRKTHLGQDLVLGLSLDGAAW